MLPVGEALCRKKTPLLIITTCSCALQSDVLMQYRLHIQNYHYFTVLREPAKKARVMEDKERDESNKAFLIKCMVRAEAEQDAAL